MKRLALYLLVLCFFGFSVFAQDLDDVTISGKITDSNNQPITGATISATLVSTGAERSVQSDDEGRYRLIELPPGVYIVKASAQGFGAKERKNLTTLSGQAVQLNFQLAPGDVKAEATVTVTEDDAAQVDTTRTVVGSTVTQREIEELPNVSRNPIDLVFTLGGVAEEALSTRDLAEDKGNRGEAGPSRTPEEAGIFSLSGGAAYSNNVTIEGLDNNDDRSASTRFQPSQGSIEEVQVIKSQFSAEYGRASGGRVNLRLRSGTKKFKGSAYYYFRDESLNANTWRNNSRRISRPGLQDNNPEFNFGGPIPFGYFKEKTFFFASYEYRNLWEQTVIDTYVPLVQNPRFSIPTPTNPSASVGDIAPYKEAVPTPLRNHIGAARIDHNFNANNTLGFIFQIGKRQDFRQFSGGTRLAEALVGNSSDTNAFSLSYNLVISSNAVNQAKFQYSTLKPRVISDTTLTAPVVLIGLPAVLDRGASTLIAGSSTTGSSDRQEDRWQFQDSLNYITGTHSLKFGGDIQRIKSLFIDRGDATGTFNFGNTAGFLANTVTRYRHNFNTTSQQQNTYYGIYFQDEWRIKPTFSLNYGIRYENETIIDDKNNFGPRLGIAWDILGDGKGALRFGTGIFYNRALLRTIDDFSLTTQSLIFDTNAIPAGGQRDAVLQTLSQRFPSPLTQTEAQTICTQSNLTCGTAAFGRKLDPTLKIPESYQFNIGFERELNKDFVAEVNFTWNKTANLWREFNANAINLGILNARTGGQFNNLAEYLLSRTFNNAAVGGVRPLYNTNGARDAIRFVTSFTPPPVGDPSRCTGTIAPTNADQGGCQIIGGIPTTIINLNSQSAINTSAPITVAMAALQQFRPDPSRTQLEQLASIGNSLYNGFTFELRKKYRKLGGGFGASFRMAYTLSLLKDDGIVNTSSAQIAGDFSSEWARSLQDRRHRLAFSGSFDTPSWMGKLRFSPLLRLGSSAPFNLSAGGIDRNLDDVNTDRPNFNANRNQIVWRAPGSSPSDLLAQLSIPTIGSKGGNLERNSGRGPATALIDVNISRQMKFTERIKLRPSMEISNVLNARVFSFGTAFINSNSTADTFLVPNRTLRERQIRLGLRLDF